MSFDLFFLQFFNGVDSIFLDRLALTLTSGFAWIPLYLSLFFLIMKNNNSMAQISFTVGFVILCLLFSGILSDVLVKPYIMRLRPINDPSVADILVRHDGCSSKSFSFYSSHAANTIAVTTFFFLLTRSKVLLSTMTFWALFMAWTRLYLGMHWFTDVLVGIAWGIFVSSLLYTAYNIMARYMFTKMKFISSHYTITGYDSADINVVACVIVFTFFYGVARALLMV